MGTFARTSKPRHRVGRAVVALDGASPGPGVFGERTVRHAGVMAPEPTEATNDFPVTIDHAFGSTLIVNVSTITSPEEYAELAKIAPTLAGEDEVGRTGGSWQERTRILGRALGAASGRSRWSPDLEGRIASAASAHPSFAKKVVVVAQYDGPDEPIITLSGSGGTSALLRDLGFVVAELPNRIDPAVLDEEELDLLVWESSSERTKQAEVEADPRLRALPVLKEKRVAYMDGAVSSATLFESVVSLRFGLDRLTPLLKSATT